MVENVRTGMGAAPGTVGSGVLTAGEFLIVVAPWLDFGWWACRTFADLEKTAIYDARRRALERIPD